MINKNCPCKRKRCERYGDCEACLAHHKDKKHAPYCKREKTEKLMKRSKFAI